jgi:riboflavin biosynthesis pyrimidine reductase
MGLLRSVADAVVIGAGTLREGQGRPLTAARAYPPLSKAYAEVRSVLQKDTPPLAVIVTASGNLDPAMEIFHGGEEGSAGQVLVVTTSGRGGRLRERGLPESVLVVEASGAADNGGTNEPQSISTRAILEAISRVQPSRIVLVEGGPHLLADFYAEGLIDEQFLTLSPQLVGHDAAGSGFSLLEGRTFAPARPLWAPLLAAKLGGNHLFLRYGFMGSAHN